VLLEVYLDTCHSGSGLRGAEFGLHAPKPRYIAPPDHEFQKKTARMRGFTLHRPPSSTAKKAVAGVHHILWTGCKANETSADAYFNGRYNGAFTYYFYQGDARYQEHALAQGCDRENAHADARSLRAKTRSWKATQPTAHKRSPIDSDVAAVELWRRRTPITA